MTASENIIRLVAYGLQTNLLSKEDTIFTVNRLLMFMKLDGMSSEESVEELVNKELSKELVSELELILEELMEDAYQRGILADNGIVSKDLFDAELMSALMGRPSEIIAKFREYYRESPKKATDYYYKLSCDSNYIRRGRIKKDKKWETETEYGDLTITINLSKPEKDPKAIAAARNMKQGDYPKCLLCRENEGYAGRINHPGRGNHRIIPVIIQDNLWGFQYSPYVYYNEHCIVFNGQHVPMKIDHNTFCKLFDFVKQFPHYILGSNADLPIVGGSILTHDHFQGGNHVFPMAKASLERSFKVKGFEDIEAGVVKWPMSVIRLSGKNTDRMIALADHILNAWRYYSDEEAFIFAQTDGEPHNTITPIARKKDEYFELDLVLRNNITTKEHPLGVYHPHENLHHIKKENIGLIEVMGLAVLPARLSTEMEEVKEAILNGLALDSTETLLSHAKWIESFLPKYEKIDETNIDDILKKEIGLVFMQVLVDAGVYKRTADGQQAFDRFIHSLNNETANSDVTK